MYYNLTDKPWISVLQLDGHFARLGLAEVLRKAHTLRLAYGNPMDRMSVFRFLLALGYWCFANTKQAPVSDKPLPQAWTDWLEQNQEYFELFGDGPRFYQSPGTSRIRPSTDLIHELPTANNFWHFRHVTDFIDGICPACCVTGLLRLPLFTTVGGSGIGAGINRTPPFYAIWQGDSLSESIFLNWEPTSRLGVPAWLNPFGSQNEKDVALLTGLTWLPRKVFLLGPVSDGAKCSACGEEHEPLVYACNNEAVKVPPNLVWNDPHAIYRDDRNGLTAQVALMSGDKYTFANRDWHKPLVGFLRAKGMSRTATLFLVGFTSVQAKCVDIWEKTIALSGKTSSEELLDQISERAYSLHRMRKQDRRGDYKESVGITAVADIIPHVEHRVDVHSGEMVENSGNVWQEADEDYGFFMKRFAVSLMPEITVAAKLEREQLARRKPWPLKPKSIKKPSSGDDNE